MWQLLSTLDEGGLDALTRDRHVLVQQYDDVEIGHHRLYILNYDQVKSPRSDAVACACRGTIVRRIPAVEGPHAGVDGVGEGRRGSFGEIRRLRVGEWELMGRSFLRFFQVGERDIGRAEFLVHQRPEMASSSLVRVEPSDSDAAACDFFLENQQKIEGGLSPEGIIAQTKEDGTLVIVWFDHISQKWRASCRFNLLEDYVASKLLTYRELVYRTWLAQQYELPDPVLERLCTRCLAISNDSADESNGGGAADAVLGVEKTLHAASIEVAPSRDDGFVAYSALGELDSAFEKALDEANLDRNVSYSFELCSPLNRVVTPYSDSSLCLLAGHRLDVGDDKEYHADDTSRNSKFADITCFPTALPVELSADELDAVASRIGARRPHIEKFSDIAAVTALLEEKSRTDPTFEGFVVYDADGRRWKAKNPGFFFIHRLRYRGWSYATAERLVPFILANEEPELFGVLSHYDTVDVKEIRLRLNECRRRLMAELSSLKQTWEELRDLGSGREFYQSLRSKGHRTWKIAMKAMRIFGPTGTVHNLEELWRRSAVRISKDLFALSEEGCITDGDFILEPNHQPPGIYCPLSQLRAAGLLPLAEDDREGLAANLPVHRQDGSWSVQCYCGQDMDLERLKCDLLEKRFCPCGDLVSVGRFKVPLRVWRCGDPGCGLFHSAERSSGVWIDGTSYDEGDPMGVPCSLACKTLRIMVQTALRMFLRQRRMTFEQAMVWLASALGVELAEARVARLGHAKLLQALEIIESERTKQHA